MISMQKTRSPWSFANVWRSDVIAGFQVSLIALPLCLGIAIASNFPPMAGIITAVIGGLAVSRLSGSQATIMGPAAGLIVIILDGVERLGQGDPLRGYKLTLAAIVCAGILELIAGLLKFGRFSAFFPVAVIHGMMAAIGVIIITKQLPILFGSQSHEPSLLASLAYLPEMMLHANPAIALIGLGSLALTMLMNASKGAYLKKLPTPIAVVSLAAIAGALLGLGTKTAYSWHEHTYHFDKSFLISLPAHIFSALAFPDFSAIASRDFIIVTLSIASIASLESLLSATAIDKLDPWKRRSDLNRDLVAVGLGTIISGFLGGLPMIAEIVRSSANINSGAKTSWANFFHGLFLLLAVLLIPGLIKLVPLAALAALLIYTGFRLASPKEILKIKEIGFDQLLIFMTTLLTTLASDLLIGIAAGIAAKILLHLARQVSPMSFFRCRFSIEQQSDTNYLIRVMSPLIFSNILSLLKIFASLPPDAKVQLDLNQADFIDHSAIEKLHELQYNYSLQGGAIDIIENKNHIPYSEHLLAARRIKA